MKVSKMKKDDLELMSNQDITNLLLEEKGKQNTAELFNKIIGLLELPESTFDDKIGDYFTCLSTDKRFVLLEDGTWDLKNRYKATKLVVEDDDDDIEEEKQDMSDGMDDEDEERDNYDSQSVQDEYEDDDDDDYKDLVVLDEDELELEQ